ncbi:hypothetical protein JCM9957A_42080 [Kineosporia succinea]
MLPLRGVEFGGDPDGRDRLGGAAFVLAVRGHTETYAETPRHGLQRELEKACQKVVPELADGQS